MMGISPNGNAHTINCLHFILGHPMTFSVSKCKLANLN